MTRLDSEPLFAAITCVIHPESVNEIEHVALKCCLLDGGASIVPFNSRVDSIQGDTILSKHVTHVICRPEQYSAFVPPRKNQFYHIIRPEWVYRCYLYKVLIPLRSFSANPDLFFGTLAFVADQVENDPKRVVFTLIRYFGGMIIESEEQYKFATHYLVFDHSPNYNVKRYCISKDFDPKALKLHLNKWEEDLKKNLQAYPMNCGAMLPDCVIGYLSKIAGITNQHVVTYKWLEKCLQEKTRLPEAAFRPTYALQLADELFCDVSDQIAFSNMNPGYFREDNTTVEYLIEESDFYSKTLTLRSSCMTEKRISVPLGRGSTVLIARHVSPSGRIRVVDCLQNTGVEIVTVPNESSCEDIYEFMCLVDVVVCQYRSGKEYREAVKQKKRIVSVLWVLFGQTFDMKLSDGQDTDKERLLQSLYQPVRAFGGIPSMHGFVITLSGFTNRTNPTRNALQTAICLTGACILPILSRNHSTHLLCYEPGGEKYHRAKQWNFANILKHQWLLDCLERWKYVSESTYSWTSFDCEGQNDERMSTTIEIARLKENSDDNKENMVDLQPEMDTQYNQRKVKSFVESEPENEDTQQRNGTTREIGAVSHGQETPSSLVLAPIMDTLKINGQDDEHSRRVSSGLELLTSLADVSLNLQDTGHASQTSSCPQSLKRKMDVFPAATSSPQKSRRKNYTVAKKASTHQFRFLLTGNKDECASNSSVIAALGGRVCQSGRKFDMQCTHVICSELKRTEKFVAGCAAGKWILRPSFLCASSQAGYFVDEAPHEWGAESTSQDKVDSRIWYLAPQFWRNERAAGRPGVYNGWRFLIHPRCIPPADMCERIVIAADGVVVPSQNKAKDLVKLGSQHTDERPVLALLPIGLSPRDAQFKMFKTTKLKCVNAGFLIDYITKDQQHRPQYKDYLIGG